MKLYAKVWIFLLLLTAVEVWLAYAKASPGVMLTALLMLSMLKAAYIVAYFMHMKFEKRLLPTALFPMLLVCILALLMLLPDAAHAQCVMCGRTAAAQNRARTQALNRGIVLLTIPPVAMLALLLNRARRKNHS